VGIEVIIACYGDFHRLKAALTNLQQSIVASRKDRENRDAIYKTVAGSDFPDLVAMHAAMMASKGIMLKIAAKREKERRRNNFFGFGGIVVAVLGVSFGIIAWKYPHLLGG
jgi:hypothetical protein